MGQLNSNHTEDLLWQFYSRMPNPVANRKKFQTCLHEIKSIHNTSICLLTSSDVDSLVIG